MVKYVCKEKTNGRYQKYKEGYTKYRKEHRDEINKLKKSKYGIYKIARLRWLENNKDKFLAIRRKQNYRRRGNLGYFQLNDRFEGSVGHHINKDMIIYIPKKVHESVSHNVLTGRNMKEINKLAFEFLEGTKR